jgi:hypothetical protein
MGFEHSLKACIIIRIKDFCRNDSAVSQMLELPANTPTFGLQCWLLQQKSLFVIELFSSDTSQILPRIMVVTIDGIWNGEWIY